MCFIELTNADGNKTWINLDAIHEMRPYDTLAGLTILFFSPSESTIVDESIDDILTLGAAVLSGQRALEVA